MASFAAAPMALGFEDISFDVEPVRDIDETPEDRALTVTFANVGNNAKSYTVTYDAKYDAETKSFAVVDVSYPVAGPDLPNLNKSNHVFMGWDNAGANTAVSFSMNDFYSDDEGGAKAVTLTANYIKQNSEEVVKTYRIVYEDSDGNSVYETKKVELVYDPDALTQPEATVASPSLTGYELANAEQATIKITADQTESTTKVIYNKVENLAHYKVEFHLETLDENGKASGTYVPDDSMTQTGTYKYTSGYVLVGLGVIEGVLTGKQVNFPEGFEQNGSAGTLGIVLGATHTAENPAVYKVMLKRIDVDIKVYGIDYNPGKNDDGAYISAKYGETVDINAAMNSSQHRDDFIGIASFVGSNGSVVTKGTDDFSYNFPTVVPLNDIEYYPQVNGNENKKPLTITFNPNGGQFTDGTTDSKNSVIYRNAYISTVQVSYTGHSFLGWYVDVDGDGVLSESETTLYNRFGDTVVKADQGENVNLIAKWEKEDTYVYVKFSQIDSDDSIIRSYLQKVLISDAKTLSYAQLQELKPTSEYLVETLGWPEGFYNYKQTEIFADYWQENTFSYDQEDKGKTIAEFEFKVTDKYAYNVFYYVENEDGSYSEIKKSVKRSSDKKAVVTEYAPIIAGYDLVDSWPYAYTTNGILNAVTMNLENDGQEMRFIYEKTDKGEEVSYQINMFYYDESGSKVEISATKEAVVGKAIDVTRIDFFTNVLKGNKDNAKYDFAGREILASNVTSKIIQPEGADGTPTTVFNIELTPKVSYYDTYNNNALLTYEIFHAGKTVDTSDTYYTKNSPSVDLSVLKPNGTKLVFVNSNGDTVKTNQNIAPTQDMALYAHITHPVVILNGEGTEIYNNMVPHGEAADYDLPLSSEIPAIDYKDFSHWEIAGDSKNYNRNKVKSMLASIDEAITLEQVHRNNQALDLVFEATATDYSQRFDRKAVEESEINLAVTNVTNNTNFSDFTVEYKAQGEASWSNSFPSIRNSEDSKEVQYRISAKGYQGYIIGSVKIDVTPIALTIDVPSFSVTTGTQLTATQIATANADIDAQIEAQLLALGIADPSKYSVNFGNIEFAYDATLVNTADTYSAALGLLMEKRGETYSPNEGNSEDGLVYTISKFNYNITVNHGDLTVSNAQTNTTENNTNEENSDVNTEVVTPVLATVADTATPAAAAPTPVVLPATDDETTDIDDSEVPTASGEQTEIAEEQTPTAAAAEQVEIEDTDVPTSAAEEQQNYWYWIIFAVIVLATAVVVIITKQRKKA